MERAIISQSTISRYPNNTIMVLRILHKFVTSDLIIAKTEALNELKAIISTIKNSIEKFPHEKSDARD